MNKLNTIQPAAILMNQEFEILKSYNAKLVESEKQVIKQKNEAMAELRENREQNAILY